MFNNAIDHAETDQVSIGVEISPIWIRLRVMDRGVGIFAKIQKAFNLSNAHHAVLELSKGKLTTDPARHTGEGIFFTSRLFDSFDIVSGGVYWGGSAPIGEWVVHDTEQVPGTSVEMAIRFDTTRTTEEVFDRFAGEDFRFGRTQVPILIARLDDETLHSRSSARRVLARLERFDEVLLDFANVATIGQPFADEIFRVFAAEHPNVRLTPVNASPRVLQMISRAHAAASEQQAATDQLRLGLQGRG